MVANLCDLLERVWRHGTTVSGGHSALWAFLAAMAPHHADTPAAKDVLAIAALGDLLVGTVGKARAWLRLALEKKTLAIHLAVFLRCV